MGPGEARRALEKSRGFFAVSFDDGWRDNWLHAAPVLRELEQKAEHVSWNQDHRQTWFVLFSMGGYTDELKQLAEGRADLLLVDDRK